MGMIGVFSGGPGVSVTDRFGAIGLIGVAAGALCVWGLRVGVAGDAREDAPQPDPIVELGQTLQAEGDPEAGHRYLLYGDYIGSGIPVALADMLRRDDPDDDTTPLLRREGNSADVAHQLNRFVTAHGAEVVAGSNCLDCHAQVFEGELVIGLGNTLNDWSGGGEFPKAVLRGMAAMRYARFSPERRALEQYLRGVDAVDGQPLAPFAGVNPAFRIEELAASWRDPETLAWQDERVFPVADRMIAGDVPPWWHVKKKNALYYNGMGRGDFAKLIQQITVVGIDDHEDAQRIRQGMNDLLAYLRTIEPPPYPKAINQALAKRGEAIFTANCAACHGTYGDDWTYPNKLVPVDVVGTDPRYARTLIETNLTRWYNRSWFATTEPRSWVEPTMAYIAPPLDGIWITAPYLHNGSVPTLEALLDSSKRPTYWRRSFRDDDYDHDRVGWNYEAVEGPIDPRTYDTTLPGFTNQGHTFGDDLTPQERRALIEYLKSL